MAYYNIKRLQIDQHRAWMLRAMLTFHLGTIITTRLLFLIAGNIISDVGSYYQIQTCDEVCFLSPRLALKYPECRNATGNPSIFVKADFSGKNGPEEIGAAIGLSFGMSIWYAIAIHMIGVEIHLRLTPAEEQRLRTVSYERQLETGYRNLGSAGLTVDRWGDALAWKPAPSASAASPGEGDKLRSDSNNLIR
ncbi:hypothetical protein HYALB_00010721 [Hymenoscyphus albidus]|uniref:Uncharacterized protein n=1 Tax=Hymenoscyphus albidus TaxID=595503 RepID=A0A9N9LMW9_9HELO|nr:hypothetical protein HYALB_00010721 [Hymenoscyphus albidus]